MSTYSKSVTRLIGEFAKLPGIGNKTAERLTYHILRTSNGEALGLADAIRHVKDNVRNCNSCYNFAEDDLCDLCRDPRRDATMVCVVEQPRDVMALEKELMMNDDMRMGKVNWLR